MNDRMRELKAVASKINGLNGFVKSANQDDSCLEHEVENGSCYAKGILSKSEISISDVYLDKGTIFPLHSHEVNEWCIVYRGKLQIEYSDGATKILEASESMFFPKGQLHRIIVLEETRCACIVVPTTGGFPNAR